MEVVQGVNFRRRFDAEHKPIKWQIFRDSKARKLIRGKDFPVESTNQNLRSQAHQAAKRAGYVARTQLVKDGIIVQWFLADSESAK